MITECDKCHKEIPNKGKWSQYFSVPCLYLGHEIDLCADCYEKYKHARRVFEHEFLTAVLK